MENTADAYRIENLSFTYPNRETPAVRNVSLKVRRGEFLAVCGPSGCGKTTLLRQLKPSAAPHGVKSGGIFFENQPLEELTHRSASAHIGFVMQSPENQIVTDKVWHELAFGLESLGLKTPEIRLRVAEMASFFGMAGWFRRPVTELSGGQKQLLSLASIMAMQPRVLILDEPTGQLDPIAAAEFLATVGKINRELGVTVIITEHRLEEVFPLCDRAAVMDGGGLLALGRPAEIGAALRGAAHAMFLAMPAPMRVWAGVENSLPCPVTVREGRIWLEQMPPAGGIPPEKPPRRSEAAPSVELADIWFKYGQSEPDIVRGLSFKAYPGEIAAILGGNGAGKTTTLNIFTRANTPYRGKVRLNGADLAKIPEAELFAGLLGVLPQNPQALFAAKTVDLDLMEMLSGRGISKREKREKIANISRLCRLDGLLPAHPYDLSGGEQQRAALAKVLLLNPKILLLDEPTKGLDAEFKLVLAGILRRLAEAGATVLMVSHDVEFCAEQADRCALFFDGMIAAEGTPREFFSGNSFYTTSVSRMARGILPGAVKVGDVVQALGGADADPPLPLPPDGADYKITAPPSGEAPRSGGGGWSWRRALLAALSAAGLIAAIVFAALNAAALRVFMSGGDAAVNIAADAADTRKYVGIMLALAFFAFALVLSLTWKRDAKAAAAAAAQTPAQKRKLSRRTLVAAAMILLAVPLTIYVGIYYFGDRKYYFISMLIILETMLPFALVFEGRKPQARELVTVAMLCAIGIIGRAAFFMLPQFKPVVALVIISGVAFGGETGFLVGAMTGLVSNVFFGQGPWTPWQMFAFGIIGFLAGVLFRKGFLRRSRAALCVFGALAAQFIYGLIMDSSMVIMYQVNINFPMFLASWLQGLPFNLVHAVATAFFLFVLSEAMLEKLDRVKVKYGLTE